MRRYKVRFYNSLKQFCCEAVEATDYFAAKFKAYKLFDIPSLDQIISVV